MALFPCDASGHRYRGSQQTIYAAICQGRGTVRRKLRLCDPHFAGFHDQLALHYQDAQMGFDAPAHHPCACCGQLVLDESAQFFATVYARGAEREDFWAPLHLGCVDAIMEDWRLTADMV